MKYFELKQAQLTRPFDPDVKAATAAHNAAKSVVGHAVVGGIVAGPAGAIVGAIAGKAKNDRKK